MSSRYAQVARTYLRWPFWVLAIPLAWCWIAVLVWPPQDLARPGHKDAQLQYILPIALVASWWAAAISILLKEQMADWRSALLPRFRAPHLGVSALLLALIAFAMPAALGWLLGLSSLGMIAASA